MYEAEPDGRFAEFLEANLHLVNEVARRLGPSRLRVVGSWRRRRANKLLVQMEQIATKLTELELKFEENVPGARV